jgi:hypothetical protein
MKKTKQMRDIEVAHGKCLEVLIRELIEAGKDWEEVAADLGVSRGTLFNWTLRMGGEVRRTIHFRSEDYTKARI